MTETSEHAAVDLPRVYLIRMMVFTILVAIIGAILYPQFETAFMANPGLNGLIVFMLLLGILYAFRMVWRLFREVNWVNHFRISEPGLDSEYTPRLLAPMASLLRDRQGTVLSPLSMRSLLDSLASRLDEARDISRYLIGLLIFLGLLGTFWGLLETVTSVGATIRSLDVSTAESATIFEELKAGLAAPLAGMGTSFSSSLFGLAGALVLGFLDLQASQAQNRFYNDLEDWLSSITDIAAGDGSLPQYLQYDLSHIEKGITTINRTLDEALADPGYANEDGSANGESLARLAGAVEGLVQQMREEQKIVRQWAHAQSEQQSEIRRMLAHAAGGDGPRAASAQTGPPHPAPQAAPHTGRLRPVFRPARRPEE
ncbi:MAG TPA: flagellar motor protein MotA [Aestuariivirgaceae bacterium]|nr:flagellar motor protein MotA [Aestuariivirgaceae bacterium]